MADETSWYNLGENLKRVESAVEKLPAPPIPDDSFSQKMNDLHRAVEGLRETINGRLEAEQVAADNA